MENFVYTQGGDRTQRTTHPSWYRGEHCNFIPSKSNLQEPGAVEAYILAGWLPEAPFLKREQVVTTFGSCFARHVATFLRDQGYTTGMSLVSQGVQADFANSHLVRFGEGMVNTYALRQQFEWAYEGASFDEHLWHGSSGEIATYDAQARAATRDLFDRTDVFILTLGLSEVWYNKRTEDVFWRAIPREQFDPEVHGFRVASCAENTANLERIVEIVRRHRPGARIVLTLSPVPLVATFRPVSCITANAVSKSILRAAIDEVMRAHAGDPGLLYWPSYEIVKECFLDPYEEDNRHVLPEVVELVMELFKRHYLTEAYSAEEVAARRERALGTLAAIPGVGRELATQLFDQGWRTPRELAQTPAEVLMRLYGVNGPEAAAALRQAAAEAASAPGAA